MVQVLVLVVVISVLTYLGVVKFVVETVGRVLAVCLKTSPPEGINAVANMFLHVVNPCGLPFTHTVKAVLETTCIKVPIAPN